MTENICLKSNFLFIILFLKYVYNSDTCLTPICVLEASRILQSLDESVSPCDDFYQFSCGQWLESTKIPDHRSSISSFSQLQEVVYSRIQDIIDEIDLKNENRIYAINLKNYFNSCMNLSAINSLSDKPLRDLLKDLIDDDWPIIPKDSSSLIDWTDLYIKLKNNGLISNMLFTITVSTDIRNNSRRILSLDQPSFGLKRESLLNSEPDLSFESYRKLMLRSAQKLSANYIDFNKNMLDSISEFEINLANISMSREQRRNLSVIIYETDDNMDDITSSEMSREERDYLKSIYSIKTISQLKSIATNIDWLRIMRSVVVENITEKDKIIINDISFIKKLNKLLKKTNNRIIINYMIWRVILSKHSALSEDWLRIRHEYDSVISGIKRQIPRWHQCIKTIESGLPLALYNLYVKHNSNPDIKRKASDLIETVRLEFKNTLIQSEWIDEQTMKQALDKLDKMKIMVAYPDQILNQTNIEQYYENLSLNSSDFFGNILRVNQWKQKLSFNLLQKPNDIKDWKRVGPLTRANAFYNKVKNMVLIPAAILQGVFYNKDRPNYLNYGAIGKTAGHEIIHGFDSHGRHFDAEGNLNYWWNGDTDQKYREKAECFVRQYSDYFIDFLDLNINGNQTKAENIADNGGIKLAFSAYTNYLRQYGPEPKLPALNYTSEQLFWISYGVHYCSKQNSQSLRNLILTDSHTPKKFRINGALSNSEQFSQSFNCPVGSPMNPINKCWIW